MKRVPFRLARPRWHGPVPIVALTDPGKHQRVELAKLYATQSFVDGGRAQRPNTPLPVVASWKGRLFIQDGHHRLARKKWRGQRTAIVFIAEPNPRRAAGLVEPPK